jgi:hypothetical protein
MNLKSVRRQVLLPLCGEYTGLQVFLAPITLFYLIETDSLLSAATSLLSFRIHYFPLLAFSIILAFVLFMMLKMRLIHQESKTDYIDNVIELNISVMALVIIALITYAVSSFLSYFYGINGTIKTAMYLLFKLYTSLIIMSSFMYGVMLAPFHKRNYGRKRAVQALKAWSRKNKLLLLRYSLVWVLIIIAATRFYQLLIQLVYDPAISIINDFWHIDIRLHLYSFKHVDDIFVNLFVCLLAFLISNLLFYPIIYIFNWLANKFIPYDKIMSSHHAQAAQ